MRNVVALCLFFVCLVTAAQEANYQSLLLDASLTKNANAVVRADETEITLFSESKMEVRRKRVVTVLKVAGKSAINPTAYYDLVTKIKDIQAVVYDNTGKEIKKIKKKDFKDVSAVDGGTLYSDSRLKYFEYVPTALPYTIAFDYTYETENTAFIPKWAPVDEYHVSTEKSSYKLTYPAGTEIRKKEKNFDGYPITNASSGHTLAYTMINLPAERKEMLSPSFYEVEPLLFVGLNKFHLAGIAGEGDDWNSFGKWQYQRLLKERDVLPAATVQKIAALVQGVEDPIEKAKLIYKYVQDNTRYISVQLGIGGWMPITASEVDKVKYGDCKGLTNYTKALLKSQGIDAYYSIVWAGSAKRSLEADFASMQGNHVILNVPTDGDDIWLECTSQEIPFGFLSDFTDDRDVLVVTPEGGKIKHTATYLNADNTKHTKANYQIAADGTLTAKVEVTSHGLQYDTHYPIEGYDAKDRDAHYKEYWSNVNGLRVKEMAFKNDKAQVAFVENVAVEVPAYATKVGADLLFKINPFDANSFVPDRYRNRKQAFEISRGYVDESEFKVSLPDNYSIGDLPTTIAEESKYGSYTASISKVSEKELLYTRKLVINKGRYPKEEYDTYRNFRRKVAKGDNIKLVLTNK